MSRLLRRHAALAAAVVLCIAHFATFDVVDQRLVTDVRYYVYFSWQLTQGAVPHLDLFDNKTQLATFAGALFHAVADRIGADPLIGIRLGYLGLAALGGMLLFWIGRRLDRGSGVAGLLALTAYCSFGLLGLMPAIGNIPKLLMAVAASAAALLVRDGRWFWAGVLGALAFMDWQVGALVWLAAFATAWSLGRPRLRAAILVASGGVTGIVPFVMYYAWNGALGAAVGQTILTSFMRGTAAMQKTGLDLRLRRIGRLINFACPEQQWLFFVGLLGMGVVAWWLWRWRRREELRLLLPLAIYHFGLVGFCLVDFQVYGDFFLLLHSIAFFLGVLWIAMHRFAVRRLGGDGNGRAWGAAVAAVVLLLAVAAGRPGPLRPELRIRRGVAGRAQFTLADQRKVAEQVRARVGNGPLVFLNNSELLFLMGRTNALPCIYWNNPAWFYYRRSPQEEFFAARDRVVRSADPDAVLLIQSWIQQNEELEYLSEYNRARFSSGGYTASLLVRKGI